jgi:hypothetical protein
MKKAGDLAVTGFPVLARPKRFELLTPWFVARYSIQLSYGRFEELRIIAEVSNR